MILYAGSLQILYERGFIRYISYQGSEILRMIYFALRDDQWNTASHTVLHEEKDISWETFHINYRSTSELNGEGVIAWNAQIQGKPDCSITFTLAGTVIKTIKKNRAGFCVLHPLTGVTGKAAEITTWEGEQYRALFPTSISGENPFKNIKTLKWEFDNQWFELEFEGDMFETEDQRNWTDASFKTFCTPSHLPIPVQMTAGEKIFQRVTFRPLQKLPPITARESTVIELTKTEVLTKLPKVGICLRNLNLKDDVINAIKSLGLDHLRIEVVPSENDWIEKLSRQCEIALKLKLSIYAVLFASENVEDEIEAFIAIVKQNRLSIKAILLLSLNIPVTTEAVSNFAEKIKQELPSVTVGAGTESDFKEINRHRVTRDGLDFISYAAQPQVHASDDRTLIENIAGIRETGLSGAKIYSNASIQIAPLTLKKFNAEKMDKRQQTELGALWTFGSLRAAAEGHIESISLFEINGTHGIVSLDGTPYPIYFTIQKLLKYVEHDVVILRNPEPLLVDALLFTNARSTTLFLVNYTDDLQTVRYGRNEYQILPNAMQEVNLSST